MEIRNKRILVIGIDQAITYFLNKFIKEGVTPNIAQLAESGVMGEAIPSVPCDTPTNWTTIATGANTAVHGATSFYMHLVGEPLDMGLTLRSRTQLSRYCGAEYFWDVADREGYTPFVMNYPAGWPSHFKKGVMSLFTWSIPESLPIMLIPSSIYIFKVRSENPSTMISKVEKNSKSISYSPILQATIYIKNKDIKKQSLIEVFLINSEGRGYDQIRFYRKVNNKNYFLKKNEWSDWIEKDIKTNFGVLPCIFKLKPIKIDPEGNSLKIQLSQLYNTKGWSTREDFSKKIVKNAFEYNLPEKKKVEFMIYGSLRKFLLAARQESLTLTESIKYAQKELNWQVCFFHYHHLDSINHTSLAYLDKNSPVYTEKKEKKAWENIKNMYRIVDRMVEELMKSCVDENTIILFISDHGAVPIWKIIDIPLIFAKTGLINYKLDNRNENFIINWNKTFAFPYMEPPFIWINLKNRDPNGIVKQDEYEGVRNRVIEILENVKDPMTNKKVFHSIIKKEDAFDLGLNSDRIGDLIYFLNPPYGIFDGNLNSIDASNLPNNHFKKSEIYDSQKFFGAHAYYHPSTKFDKFSISAPFIICGPGIKEGVVLNDLVNLIDIAPTLSHILKIPIPLNSQGKVLFEIFE